ncbi:nucleoside-diphosphate-sugar epimerase [Meridianimarinicoccus roseus]|uniref:Nucleoside-diphosphate-sugar epimerase n=1 Tax=Meridianimarinicoccus roseus TaxID=2072018 RepID=A0A2V2LCJ5_9RHOB|nr:NAD(P)-dependent oxidoreductase [Meridianimarinicoccus roseus]PWR03260.1 nucleoside-diphosphate-sugar epimerase [Meridianimarinicoccus roseus]
MRILFTGGTGKAGRHVIPDLLSRGHEVVNIDLAPLDLPGVPTLIADITDSGQMFQVLTSHGTLADLEAGTGPRPFDAVVHFAAIPRILIRPDGETFRVNTQGTYNVLEAATKLGIGKIVIASSETTYGICFNDGPLDPPHLPITEDTPTDPMDSYGLSKVCNEATARAFQRRSGADICALRIGNVIEPHEYETLFPSFFADPDQRLRNAFCYIDARDLGQIVHLCLTTPGLGYQVFNAGNDGNSVALTTPEIIARYYPNVPLTRPMGESEAIYSNAKIREVLGFVEEHPWTRYVADPRA